MGVKCMCSWLRFSCDKILSLSKLSFLSILLVACTVVRSPIFASF